MSFLDDAFAGIGDSKKQANPAHDLTKAGHITLDVKDIRPYIHNPRVTQNPKYAEIKASIMAVGLMHEPVVTKLPGDDHFVIRDGGNTRLSILKELFSETGDEQYKTICCMYKPFHSDTRQLAGHLSENENRGELSWIEKSIAVVNLKKLYDASSEEPVSQRELVKKLRSDGYAIDQSAISRMIYTVEYLLPTIPDMLYAGLGKRQLKS